MASLHQCQCVHVVCVTTCMFGGVSLLYPALPMCRRCQSTAQVERLLLEHGEKVVDRQGAEIDWVEMKIKIGMERAGGGAVSHNHTHSVYTCSYSLYRNTPLMCAM